MRPLVIAALLTLVAFPAVAQDHGRNIWGRKHVLEQRAREHAPPQIFVAQGPQGAPAPLIGAGAPLLIAGAGLVAARLLRRKRSL